MKYAWITIKHKWYVLLASFKVDLPLWRALVHDLSKFSWAELPHYERQICGDKDDPKGFATAWLHHYHHNDHHWEHWIVESAHSRSNPTRDGCIVDNCLEMPGICVQEMVADWLGKEMYLTGSWDMTEWLEKSLPKMKLHPKTRCSVYLELELLGYPKFCDECPGWFHWEIHPWEGEEE